jgi:hypothetical protein
MGMLSRYVSILVIVGSDHTLSTASSLHTSGVPCRTTYLDDVEDM